MNRNDFFPKMQAHRFIVAAKPSGGDTKVNVKLALEGEFSYTTADGEEKINSRQHNATVELWRRENEQVFDQLKDLNLGDVIEVEGLLIPQVGSFSYGQGDARRSFSKSAFVIEPTSVKLIKTVQAV